MRRTILATLALAGAMAPAQAAKVYFWHVLPPPAAAAPASTGTLAMEGTPPGSVGGSSVSGLEASNGGGYQTESVGETVSVAGISDATEGSAGVPFVASNAAMAFAVGSPMQWRVRVEGERKPPLSFVPVEGLPEGLTVNAMTGEVLGVPTSDEPFQLRIRVTDSAGRETFAELRGTPASESGGD